MLPRRLTGPGVNLQLRLDDYYRGKDSIRNVKAALEQKKAAKSHSRSTSRHAALAAAKAALSANSTEDVDEATGTSKTAPGVAGRAP
jgi:hypothetical protein